MQIFILAEEIKLRAFLCLNNGIQCAGRFAAKASFVMIIYISTILRMQIHYVVTPWPNCIVCMWFLFYALVR